MVKQKTTTGGRIIRSSGMHLLAFGFAVGRQQCGADVSLEDSARQFVEHFGLREEVKPSSLARQLRRMLHDYLIEGI